MSDTISVIIPMYNSRDTIISCIKSVVHQTYMGLINIIVVNDGSTDDSLTLIEKEFSSLPENRYLKVINKENGGVSTARNSGIIAANTEIVALLDSDDFWLPEKLDRQMDVLSKNPDIKILGCNVDNKVYPFFGKSNSSLFTLNPYEMALKWYPATPTIIAKKSLFLEAGLFDESKRRGEDCDLWLRCMMFSKLYILNESLVEIGHGKRPYGEKGLSADLHNMFLGEIHIFRAAYKRKQIDLFYMIFLHGWIFSKYIRRVIINMVVNK